jgi:hypothetical protein
VGKERPHADSFENLASTVWKELSQVAEYTEWYAEPDISRSTWDRFSTATVALRTTTDALFSQLPDQTVCIQEVTYADLQDYSTQLPTDGSGNYPVSAIGKIFGVKSATFDNEQAVRVVVIPENTIDESDGMFSYSSLTDSDGRRPEVNMEPGVLIQDVKVSPNAPSYTGDVFREYLCNDLDFGSLLSET